MMEFASSMETDNNDNTNNNNNNTRYDWKNKVAFLLMPTEMGELLNYDGSSDVKLFHDPDLKNDNEGAVRKQLVITRAGKTGYFFNLSVTDATSSTTVKKNFSVPVSEAEMTVLKTLLSYSIPRVMLWEHGLQPTFVNNNASAARSTEFSSEEDKPSFPSRQFTKTNTNTNTDEWSI